jgi:hypothetical protein
MPYIIETSRGCGYCTHCGYGSEPSAECLHKASTRTAVATLDEAADQIEHIADAWLDGVSEGNYTVETHRQYRRIIEACHAWDESGGTVGPLPDGTVIKVRQACYVEIAAAVDNKPATWGSEQAILAAFNAA